MVLTLVDDPPQDSEAHAEDVAEPDGHEPPKPKKREDATARRPRGVKVRRQESKPDMAELPDMPMLIVGDFNAEVKHLQELRKMSNLWKGLALGHLLVRPC